MHPYVPESMEGRILEDWGKVVDALKRRDGERARMVITAHITDFCQLVETWS
jgi:DNA-binding GntR family transcriptional regulator